MTTPISRILNEADPRRKHGLNDIQTRSLIALFIVVLLAVMYALIRLLMRRYGRDVVDCPSNGLRCRTRLRAYEHVLEALPVIPYAPASTSSCGPEAETCAICLAEYEEGELIRALPRCKHFLHVECIDQWLLRSFKCPICRASVAVDRGVDDTTAGEDRRIVRTGRVYDFPPVSSVVMRSLI